MCLQPAFPLLSFLCLAPTTHFSYKLSYINRFPLSDLSKSSFLLFPFFRFFALSSAASTISSPFLGGRVNISRRFFTGLVDIIQRKGLGDMFQISLPNMKQFISCVVEADTASSQKVVALLEAKTESRKTQKLATKFAATSDSFFAQSKKEAGPSTSMGVHSSANLCIQ